MIQQELKTILEKIRQKVFDVGISNLNIENLSAQIDSNADIEVLKKHITSDEELIDKILEFELIKFAEIFSETDFEGMNAIDAILIVSRGLSQRFYHISPIITHETKQQYPDLYDKHLKERIRVVTFKIKDNLETGIKQKMYRNDLSVELVARMYMSRIIDIHNPIYFPPEMYTFDMLFRQMVDSFIRSVVTPEGMSYFEKQKRVINAFLS